uniref:Uncharacterized protein n=1 Tax=Haemonchus contortus TaxID=6289 RepID=A0A7I4YLY5_HAECO
MKNGLAAELSIRKRAMWGACENITEEEDEEVKKRLGFCAYIPTLLSFLLRRMPRRLGLYEIWINADSASFNKLSKGRCPKFLGTRRCRWKPGVPSSVNM